MHQSKSLESLLIIFSVGTVKVTLHAQHERGKVIGVHIHICIIIYSYVTRFRKRDQICAKFRM